MRTWLPQNSPPLGRLEPEVLERLGRGAVQGGRTAVVPTALGEISLRNPCRCAVGPRGELRESIFGLGECGVGLVEAALLEQRAAEHEPGVPDLVHPVLARSEALEREPRVLL